MGRRKRQADAPFSLFAFQDIVTSIIGIMFLIVILMALDLLTRELADTPSMEPPAERVEAEARQHEEMRQLEQQKADLAARLAQPTGAPPPPPPPKGRVDPSVASAARELAALEGRMAMTRDETARLEREIHENGQRIAELANDRKARAEKVAQLRREKESQREAIIETRVAKERVYLAGDGTSKTPVVVQPEPDHIRAQSYAAGSTIQQWRSADRATQLRAFQRWAKTQPNDKRFFLVFVRPNTVKTSMEMVQWLRTEGYQVGYEPLPPNVSVVNP